MCECTISTGGLHTIVSAGSVYVCVRVSINNLANTFKITFGDSTMDAMPTILRLLNLAV